METLSYLFYIVPGDVGLSIAFWIILIWILVRVYALIVDIASGKEE